MAAIARYREYEPCPALRASVRALFSFSVGVPEPIEASSRPAVREIVFGERDPFWSTLFADGHASIVTNVGDEYRIDGVWEPRRAQPHLIGPMSSFRASHYGERLIQVGAYLKPGRVMELTGTPASEFADRVVGLDELWGAAGVELQELSEEAATEERRVALLESALRRRLGAAKASSGSLDIAGMAGEIAAREGQVRIAELADAAGVSRQHLARVFHADVGVGPKLYARLARFRSALRLASSGADWAQAAVELGYADQSHFIGEFRQFSGLTPDRFVQERVFHPFQER